MPQLERDFWELNSTEERVEHCMSHDFVASDPDNREICDRMKGMAEWLLDKFPLSIARTEALVKMIELRDALVKARMGRKL